MHHHVVHHHHRPAVHSWAVLALHPMFAAALSAPLLAHRRGLRLLRFGILGRAGEDRNGDRGSRRQCSDEQYPSHGRPPSNLSYGKGPLSTTWSCELAPCV